MKIQRLATLGVITLIIAALCSSTALAEKATHSDTWLEAKLVTTITLNRHLSILDIDAEVRDQVAYLSGVVDSEIDKDLAGEVAKSIDGVKSVSNKIEVDQSASKKARSNNKSGRSFAQKIEDLTTTASVKSSLITNLNVEGFDIDVETKNGQVALKGQVRSEKEKALAIKIAENASGVKEVMDKLKVSSGTGVS